MRWRLVAVVVLSVLVLPGIAPAQAKSASKDGRYHARLTVQATSIENFENHYQSGKMHGDSTGMAKIQLEYNQSFMMTVSNGFVSLDQPEGPAESSVGASVTADQSFTDSNGGSPIHYTIAMSSDPNPGNVQDQGSGTGTAVDLIAFAVNGDGLGVRFDANAQIKGICTTNIPALPDACMAAMVFQHSVEGNAGPNTSPHTTAAPQAMTIGSTFDISSQSAADCPSCLTGATAKGDLISGYTLTYGGDGPEAPIPGTTFNWQVTLNARVTILGPAK